MDVETIAKREGQGVFHFWVIFEVESWTIYYSLATASMDSHLISMNASSMTLKL